MNNSEVTHIVAILAVCGLAAFYIAHGGDGVAFSGATAIIGAVVGAKLVGASSNTGN